MQYPPQTWYACRGEKVTSHDTHRGVLARCRLPSLLKASRGRRCYVRCYLWLRQADLREAMGTGEAHGFFQPSPTRLLVSNETGKVVGQRIVPCLGKLHLCVDVVTLNHVAHELAHALVRRMQCERPGVRQVMQQRKGAFYGGRADEEIAYEMGYWVSALHAWVASFTVTMPRGRRR